MPTANADTLLSDRTRFSRLAIAALLLSPLPTVATIVLAIVVVPIVSMGRQGWDGFGDFLFVGMATQVVLIGGTLCAALTIILGTAALWRIRRLRKALGGRWTAGAAIFISVAWLAVAWASAVTLVVLTKYYFGEI